MANKLGIDVIFIANGSLIPKKMQRFIE